MLLRCSKVFLMLREWLFLLHHYIIIQNYSVGLHSRKNPYNTWFIIMLLLANGGSTTERKREIVYLLHNRTDLWCRSALCPKYSLISMQSARYKHCIKAGLGIPSYQHQRRSRMGLPGKMHTHTHTHTRIPCVRMFIRMQKYMYWHICSSTCAWISMQNSTDSSVSCGTNSKILVLFEFEPRH